MADCGAWMTRTPGCVSGYYDWGATMSPPGAPPALPLPDYTIPISMWDWEHCALYAGNAQGRLSSRAAPIWGYYCTPVLPTPWNVISNGPYTIDVGVTGGDQRAPTINPFILYQGHAIACRFYPKSRFVPYIVAHNVTNIATGKKTVVEIRSNSTDNLPFGAPGDNNVLARTSTLWPTVTPTESPTVFANYSVPINAVLADSSVFVTARPYWIVIYSEDLPNLGTNTACADAYIATGYERAKLFISTTGYNDTAIWSARGGTVCNWAIEPTINSLAFATYTTTSGTPAINVTDFGFAKLVPTPAYANQLCFSARIDVEGKNVGAGIDFSTPRHYQKVRFSVVYKKPDGRFKTLVYDVLDIVMGPNRIFVDTGELFMPGVYTNLAVTAAVITV